MRTVRGWLTLALLVVAGSGACYLITFAQSAAPQTYVVKVNPDGTFTPQVVYIKNGDTVRWEQLGRSDSIIPVDGSQGYPAMCASRKPYNPAAPNEFTGPAPFAPPGVFTLSPLDRGFIEATGRCPANAPPLATGDNGMLLCPGGNYEETLDSTWRSPDVAGVFIRLLWSDVNPQRGVFDFSVLQREIEKAVKNGKLYSLGIKAGNDGTPDWIFSTNADNTPRSGGGGGVTRLHLQDGDSDAPGCGSRMDLGNPVGATYRQLYSALLTETAKFIKTRADWYRALAYVRLSGANLFSHENRLPKNCNASCPCNPAIFAADGYRPSGLYAFYDAQQTLLRDLFPGKPIGYMLIQDGFPRINETGGYQTVSGASSNSSPLPAAFEQTQTNLDRGQQVLGLNFVVAHNGLQPKGPGCPFEGVHPKPLRPLDDYQGPVGSGCPNRWVLREGAERQITGFQTTNAADPDRGVVNPSDLDLALQNEWDNSDGVYFEAYESIFWLAENNNHGVLPISRKTMGSWNEDLAPPPHRIRFIPSMSPPEIRFQPRTVTRFKNPGATPQYLYYVHGMKCGAGKQEWGAIVIDANSYSITNRGGTSLGTAGATPITSVGYGRIRPDAGSATPSGVAIFSYRSGQYLVSETGVPATAALKAGRIYAEVNGSLDTGLAIANPNDLPATINFSYTDAAAISSGPAARPFRRISRSPSSWISRRSTPTAGPDFKEPSVLRRIYLLQ